MKKRFIILISNILSIALLLICLSGCKGWDYNKYADPWGLKKEEDGFYYYIVDKDGYPEGYNHEGVSATILGLVDSEQHREELVIPETLGGYPVKRIGVCYQPWGCSDQYYSIDASNIERVVINHVCLFRGQDGITNLKELEINANVRFAFINPEIETIIFNVELISLTDYEEWSLMWEYKWMKKQLVEFNPCGGEQKTFAIVVKKDTRVLKPEQPTQEGYTFGGWYIDEEYETEWNFETDVVTENMTLYAKWI